MEALLIIGLFVFLAAAVSGGTAVQTPYVMGGDSVSRGMGCVSILLAGLMVLICVAGILATLNGGTISF